MLQPKKSRYSLKRTKWLGVLSSEKGVGSTYFSVAAANYFSSDRRYQTAFVDFEENSGISDIMTEELRIFDGVVGFCYKDVDYYPGFREKNLASLKKRGYEMIIIDLGSGFDSMPWETICDVVYPIINLKPWHLKKSLCFMAYFKSAWRQTRGDIYCCNMLKEEKTLLKRYREGEKMDLHSIPYIQDPMRLKETDLYSLRTIFSDV